MSTILPSTAGTTIEAAIPSEPRSAGLPPFEQRVVVYNIGWETYERLLADINSPAVRLAYDDGTLEIMTISPRHEKYKSLFRRLLDVVTEELSIPCSGFGSTTWKKRSRKKGLEADECYYLTNEPKIRGKKDIDLSVDPPPDLAIEVENTESALNRLRIYGALGVSEVWRFDGESLVILALQSNGRYAEQTASQYFPKPAVEKMVEYVSQFRETDETTWIREFRRWVRENLVQSR